MFRHIAVAAWRNLLANPLQSAIAIFGLTVGIAVAMLVALFVRNQLTFDHFIPGYDRIYRAAIVVHGHDDRLGDQTLYMSGALWPLGDYVKTKIPEVDVTRMVFTDIDTGGPIDFKRGDVESRESIYWAEENVFDILQLPVLYGDLKTALLRPDGLVIPVSIARKYFGREDVVGQTLTVKDNSLIVRAVIADLPMGHTHLQSGIFASIKASFSGQDMSPRIGGGSFTHLTYMKLRPGVSLDAFEKKYHPIAVDVHKAGDLVIETPLLPLDRINQFEGINPGARNRFAIISGVGLLILFVAAINFVNLLTAHAARRDIEVGLRKACGARRTELIIQFLGESFLVVLLAFSFALSLCEILLPSASALLGASIVLDFENPNFLLAMALGALVLTLLCGFYPAFVLSGFRPVAAIRRATRVSAGPLRNMLVTLQFATLIGLLTATWIIYQQYEYVTREAMRADINQMLLVNMPAGVSCPEAFKQEVRKLAGVRGVFCSGDEFVNGPMTLRFPGDIHTEVVYLDWGLLPLYGIKPVAGSLPVTLTGDADPENTGAVVINVSAAKAFGLGPPEAAIGKAFPRKSDRVAAVIPDFNLYAAGSDTNARMAPIRPTVYWGLLRLNTSGRPRVGPWGDEVHIKLKDSAVAETLVDIDRILKSTVPGQPIDRSFMDQRFQAAYLSTLRQALSFAICAGLAAFLACLGLLGLSFAIVEKRIKEIGVRKAMGAGSADIVRLLLWQFVRPVFWATLLAWPIAFYGMDRWLTGFPYHIDLNAGPFVVATLLAILVALLTVLVQSIRTARAVPAISLRYE